VHLLPGVIGNRGAVDPAPDLDDMPAADRKMAPPGTLLRPSRAVDVGKLRAAPRPFSPLETMLSARKLRPARVRVLPGGPAMFGRNRVAGTPSQETRSR